MKKHYFLVFAAMICGLAFTSCSDDDDNEKIKPTSAVLTFEDSDWKGGQNYNYIGYNNWSSLIDDPQYGGSLLYPDKDDPNSVIYQWNDNGNTYLAHEFANGWGDKAYWGGGHAVSNYTGVDESGATYNQQLSIPVATGHNGSHNFCVHNGYESSPDADLPTLFFSDNQTHIIDHMYVVNTSYVLNEMRKEGSAFVTGTDWLKIIATGYDENDEVTGPAEFYLAKDGDFVTDWTKFDLSPLGRVAKVTFNMDGSCQNDWGLVTPAYFAYDDVKVIF